LTWLIKQFSLTPGMETVVVDSEPPDLHSSNGPGPTAPPAADPQSDAALRANHSESLVTGSTAPPGPILHPSAPRSKNEAFTIAPPPRQLEQYRWCGPNRGVESYTPCDATVTFAYDPATRYGTVLIATPAVYHYLAARRYFTLRSLPLPRNLDGGVRYLALLFDSPHRYVQRGSPLLCNRCGPESFHLTPKIKTLFTPDPDIAEPPP
jgi:hypothetical protein